MPASLLLVVSLLAAAPTPSEPDSPPGVTVTTITIVEQIGFPFDGRKQSPPAADGVELSGLKPRLFNAGNRVLPEAVRKQMPSWVTNGGSMEFDGVQSLVKIERVENTEPCFASGSFTWEGFFFSPSTAVLKTDGAIGDRIISQFRDDKLSSTRLAIGLGRAKKDGPNSLCVSLVGSETRYMGTLPVSQDAWHHFALVYEAPNEPEAAKIKAASEAALKSQAKNGTERYPNVGGKITWYLDYKKCGEIKLTGETDRTTLPPLGKSPLVIGGRNLVPGKDGAEAKVDRGFRGLLDELQITARALPVAEFQRLENPAPSRLVVAAVHRPTEATFDLAAYVADKPSSTAGSTSPPLETFEQETLGIAGLPRAFALGGYAEVRRGRHVVRTTYKHALSPGRYRLFVRSQSDVVVALGERVVVDGRRVDESGFGSAAAGARDYRFDFTAEAGEQEFRLAALVDYGVDPKSLEAADTKPAKPDAAANTAVANDEVIVAIARLDDDLRAGSIALLGAGERIPFDDYSWRASRARDAAAWASTDEQRRLVAVERREEFWRRRHAAVKEMLNQFQRNGAQENRLKGKAKNPIDAFLAEKMEQRNVQPAPIVDDATFLRRATLDFAGRNPTWQEAEAFLADNAADKRAKLIDRLLAADDDWADSWVGYWQDLLAENPSILKPTLNNSGPFRRWIHESFKANKAYDRFAAELILMQGTDEQGGTAGFAIASGNAQPMAMKAHVVAQAFLAVDLKCARCHDGPSTPSFDQADLFSLAAMLDEKPLTVDSASTVVVPPGGRKPAVTSTLKVGDKIKPEWPEMPIASLGKATDADGLVELADRPRARLASIIIAPTNHRFGDVAVNRIWQRYFGQGIIDPVDHWTDAGDASHPALLAYLSHDFVSHGYDVKRLARLIGTSEAYQRAAIGEPKYREERTFAAQLRRRASAEQVVDSLYLAVGKSMNAEELNFDPNGTQGFLILPTPEKAWQFASLANERDRPALALPTNQMILDVLSTFGWRETRIDPWTRQDAEVNPLQPLMMANSTAVNQALRLTEDAAATAWSLEELTLEQLIDRVFLAMLARKPSASERKLATEALGSSFASRKTGKPKPPPVERIRAHVDWDKHLKGEASLELLAAEKQARAGDPPTVRLTEDFRMALEDVLWSLVNSPEFVLVP